jgi:hypothetical protein
MSANEPSSSDFWRKKLEEEPGNFIYHKMFKMAQRLETPQPFKLFKSPEIEDQDPTDLGRGGDCDIVLEILCDLYPNGRPHRLTTDSNDFAHTFLMYNGAPIDIRGVTTVDEMRSHYGDPSLRAEPVTLEQVQVYFRGHRTVEEKRRTRAHLQNHILKNIGNAFPPPESKRST